MQNHIAIASQQLMGKGTLRKTSGIGQKVEAQELEIFESGEIIEKGELLFPCIHGLLQKKS